MRKGERLYNFIVKKLYEESEIKFQYLSISDEYVGGTIRQIEDEEFDKIINNSSIK